MVTIMPRSTRPQLANTWQLVWNQGLPQAPLFRESADYRCFLKLLAEITDIYKVNVHAYALLAQSCYVVIHTEKANLSRAMRFLFGNYSQHINRTYERQGPVFRGRFYSLIFEPQERLLDIVKSVHLKPVQENAAADLNDYEWCSHRWYINPYNAPEWLKVGALLLQFSRTRSLAVKRYERFISGQGGLSGLSGQDLLSFEPRHTDTQTPRHNNKLTPELLMSKITHAYNTTHWKLHDSQSGRKNIPRLVAMYCLRNLLGLSHKEIAEITRARDTNMVGQTLYRARQTIRKDEKAWTLVGELRKLR